MDVPLRIVGWDAESAYSRPSDQLRVFVEYLLSRPPTEFERRELRALGMTTRHRMLSTPDCTENISGAIEDLNAALSRIDARAQTS